MRIRCRRRRSTSAHSSRARSTPRRMVMAPFFSALRRLSTKRTACFPLSIPLRTSERTGSVIYGMQPADHWKLLLVREPAPVEELRLTASLLLVWGMPALKQDVCFSSCSPAQARARPFGNPHGVGHDFTPVGYDFRRTVQGPYASGALAPENKNALSSFAASSAWPANPGRAA